MPSPQKCFYENSPHHAATGATGNFHNFAVMWENLVYFRHVSVNFAKSALFQKKKNKTNLRKFTACPFSPDNQTPMIPGATNAPPRLEQ